MRGDSYHSGDVPPARDAARATVRSLHTIRTQLTELFAGADVTRALACLNARTRFRFTGLYRVEPGVLHNLYLFDRENPALSAGGDIVPLNETFCAIVASTERSFQTHDAINDARVRTHPARMTVLSYLGVPVRGVNGCIAGTLCHFDNRPRIAPVGEIAVLELAATLLPRTLLIRLSAHAG